LEAKYSLQCSKQSWTTRHLQVVNIGEDSRWCATFGAVRRFGVAALWRRDLTDAEPALERRRIAFHPRLKLRDFGLQ
jgi:hypothetical protein